MLKLGRKGARGWQAEILQCTLYGPVVRFGGGMVMVTNFTLSIGINYFKYRNIRIYGMYFKGYVCTLDYITEYYSFSIKRQPLFDPPFYALISICQVSGACD